MSVYASQLPPLARHGAPMDHANMYHFVQPYTPLHVDVAMEYQLPHSGLPTATSAGTFFEEAVDTPTASFDGFPWQFPAGASMFQAPSQQRPHPQQQYHHQHQHHRQQLPQGNTPQDAHRVQHGHPMPPRRTRTDSPDLSPTSSPPSAKRPQPAQPSPTQAPVPKKRARKPSKPAPPSRRSPSPNPPAESPEGGEDDDNESDPRRRRTLERNRLAATKCRLRKRSEVSTLAQRAEAAEETNRKLIAAADSLADEVFQLKTQLLQHSDCGCVLIQQYIANEARRQVDEMSARSSTVDAAAAAAAAPLGSGAASPMPAVGRSSVSAGSLSAGPRSLSAESTGVWSPPAEEVRTPWAQPVPLPPPGVVEGFEMDMQVYTKMAAPSQPMCGARNEYFVDMGNLPLERMAMGF